MLAESVQGIANISRRRWLISAIALGSSAMAGSYGLIWLDERNVTPLPKHRLLSFDKSTAYIVLALAGAVIPLGNGYATIEQTQVLRRFDEELFFLSSDVRDDLLTALKALEYLPLTYGYFSRFSKLSLPDRQRVLRQGFTSNFDLVRAVTSSLRLIVQFFYFGHEASWARIAYDGPFSGIAPIMSEQRLFYQDAIQENNV